ncbi:Mus7/MMS22 family-domain-containing protein [Nemania abortiva]|nr:Mus7/MMS22 family-domain-containing protein [Nemania abortiva]
MIDTSTWRCIVGSMAKWKELGEVPDSDDESTWDSQESLTGLPAPVPASACAAGRRDAGFGDDLADADAGADNESQAVWDIPFSSQVSVEEPSVHNVPNPPDPEPEPEPEPEPSPPTPGLPVDESQPESTPPLSSLVELGHRIEINLPIGRPIGYARAGSEESTLSSLTDVSEHSKKTAFEDQEVPAIRGGEQTRNEDSRLGRSLRPRKPIQEHPYLLESVQYSKTWKSHGLRPVRLLAEEEKKRRQEEDSQEQDFEDDSQVTGKEVFLEESEESQLTGHVESHQEIYDMPLSDDGEPSPNPGPRPSMPEEALRSSQEDDNEFPDPNDVEKWKSNKPARQRHKRRSSPKSSSKRKLPRLEDPFPQIARDTLVLPDVDDIFDIPASPPQTSPNVLSITPMAVVNRLGPKAVTTLTPKPSSNISSRIHSPAPGHQHSELIDLTAIGDEDSENESDAASSHTDSESEPDRVRLGAKRIRGVLPASWLRLDQQASMQKSKPITRHRSPGLSPERSARKGVAQRRLALPQPGSTSALFLSDDSDDSDSALRPQRLEISFPDLTSPVAEDDAASVIEEDHIDHMFSRSKRASAGSSGSHRKRKRGRQSIFDGRPGQRKRQQRITGLLSHTDSASSTRMGRLHASRGNTGAESLEKQNRGKRKSTISQPARLSILDVIEPKAPAFIRIAARTASKRRDKGRSSPSKKIIMLGTRQDTIDAVGTLKRWSEGIIQPRDSVSLSVHPHSIQSEADDMATEAQTLAPRKDPSHQMRPSTRFSQPRRMAKQASMDSFVDTRPRNRSGHSFNVDNFPVEKPKSRGSFYRPAQLEMAGNSGNHYTFDARKRALDALYRRSRKSLSTSRDLRLEQSSRGQAQAYNQGSLPEPLKSAVSNGVSEPLGNKMKARFRKQVRPQLLDVSAPQYTHANDPLPRELSPSAVILNLSKSETTGKLLGLGPYGTHYTHHFEVFPLDRGVFFHESTILGSGRLMRALDKKPLGSLNSHRGHCTFTIDEQTLNWGPWDARTSSELGIIFDWVMDRLDASSVDASLEITSPVPAADFILIYLQDHLALIEPESPNIFASRLVDVLQTVERRLTEIPIDSRRASQSFIEVLTRILAITAQGLRLCQNLNKGSEAFLIEEILKRAAAAAAKVLLRTDLEEIRDIYGHLQQTPFRERGIRNDKHYIICWVTLIRILEEVRIPRAGFWGVICSAILKPSTERTFDATVLEQAWRNIFTLLPLGEFDNNGVAIPGVRNTAPLEGWVIPQRLLRRVFELYQSNGRQSPGFNDYLRAIVGRCHYLVEQWGWHKCHTILGTIFDFFAAQDLHNLRNEEVYQSPQFLEELSVSPSLATSLEDRCFHIYLKLIALSIKRLKKTGSTKEIKNLVARLLPNHSRQYDKVMATHEAEIAALRNHHDLLCTLFWAAPPDMRPSIQSIESLVVLGSSHKEACLISLRTWGRLSRFVVSSSEDISAYKPLADWQRNISQQVLEQFLSVESEINQQLLGMSAEACKNITQQHKNAVIRKNKKVALDLLHFSMKAFLDVMRHTQTLSAASFVLNHYPLEQILTRLSFSSADSDWGILRIALDILDYFLTRIAAFATAELLHVGQSWHEEDAIMLLERKFASPLLSVVRDVVKLEARDVDIGQIGDRDLCVEQAVILAGQLGACLVHARLARLRQFFQPGKYSLFPDVLKPTTSTSQKYVALFLATIADGGVADFKDLGLTPLDLFLAETIKPSEYLAYENRLAMSFKRLGESYLENAVIEVGNTPDYSSNRDLFNCSIVSMRKTLLLSNASQKPQLQNIFSKSLRSVMDRMKANLKSMILNTPQHLNYVEFVRSIIRLIRSQDLCPVDSFFYQISPEYSPSSQDPRLQTAGILSWGLKLEEGDSKAASGLFYLLFPSFKIALANGELGNETKILKEGMEHAHVFNFMLSTMLPAIIRTTTQVLHGWVLLDTYIEAIDARLSSACIHRQIDGDIMVDILALHHTVLAGVGSLQRRASPQLRNEDIVSLTAMIRILNLLSPSVTAYFINEPESPVTKGLAQVTDELTDFTRVAGAYLPNLVKNYDQGNMMILEPSRLFGGLGMPGPGVVSQHEEQIKRFASHMVQDVCNNWVSNEASITIRGPSRPLKPSATQSGQGTPLPRWDRRKLLQNLVEQVGMWNHSHDVMMKTTLHEALLDEFLF